jgi:hypothetical protein
VPGHGALHALRARIDEAAGFADRALYEQAEIPVELHAGWPFMERSLPGFEHLSLRREQP